MPFKAALWWKKKIENLINIWKTKRLPCFTILEFRTKNLSYTRFCRISWSFLKISPNHSIVLRYSTKSRIFFQQNKGKPSTKFGTNCENIFLLPKLNRLNTTKKPFWISLNFCLFSIFVYKEDKKEKLVSVPPNKVDKFLSKKKISEKRITKKINVRSNIILCSFYHLKAVHRV